MLTDKRVRSLKPRDSDYEVSDARLPGFGVRISPYGLKTFFYRYQTDGRRRRKGLGPFHESGDLANARRQAETIRGLVLLGEDPSSRLPSSTQSSNARTFGDVARRWMEEYAKPRKKTWRQDLQKLERNVYPKWDHTPIDSIGPADVREFLLKIAKRSGDVANAVHSVIRTIFNWAIEEGLIESNPAAIRKVHQRKPPKTIISDDDLRLLWPLWVQSQSLTGAALCLYLLTGLRQSELRTLKWSQLKEDTFELPTTKNDMPHTVFLSRQALSIVHGVREVTGDFGWVFPSPLLDRDEPISGFHQYIAWLREQAPVDNKSWSVQSLRRTASTILARQGVEPYIIDIFLNHVFGDVTHRHYVRYRYAEQARDANQRLGDFVENLVGPITLKIADFNYGRRS